MSDPRRLLGLAVLIVSLLGLVPALSAGGHPDHDHEYTCEPSPHPGEPDLCVHGSQPVPDGVSPTRRPSLEELEERRERARERGGGKGRDPGGQSGSESSTDAGADSDGDSLASADGWKVACHGDGVSGNRVQAVYAHVQGTKSRYRDVAPYIRSYAASMDRTLHDAARATGGQHRLRFVTDDCRVDVAEVTLSKRGDNNLTETARELEAMDHDRTDRKYLVWVDTAVSICGVAQVYQDDRPDETNRNNRGPQYGRVDAPCWDYAETHELIHILGAVQPSSPHSTKRGHCIDEHDLMCYDDGGSQEMSVRCPNASWDTVDCGSDDYFDVTPRSGSYLATHWNIAESSFLATEATAPSSSWDIATPADLDGDGRDELLLYDEGTGELVVWTMGRSGAPGTVLNRTQIAKGWDEIVAGDYDGDGDDELSFYRASTGRFATYEATSSGRLGARLQRRMLGTGWTEIFAADHSGNGRDQLNFYRSGDGRYASYVVNADSSLRRRTHLRRSLGTGWSAVLAGDFNDNGRDQVVFYRDVDGRFASYVTRPDGSLARRSHLRDLGTGWTAVESADQARSDGDLVTFYRGGRGRHVTYSTWSGGRLRSRIHVGTLM